jgi:ribosomal protein L32
VRYECKNVTHTHPCPACGKLKVRHRLCDDYEKCATVNLSKHRGTGGPGEGEAVEQEGKEGIKA